MKVLITGGAGFIGSHLSDVLLAQGHEVAAYDNLRTGSLANLAGMRANGRFRFFQADVLDPAALAQACDAFQPTTLVHLAALVSVQDARNSPDENFKLNLEATQRVLSAVLRAKIPRVIFASSAAVYGDNPRIPLTESEVPAPIGLYGGAKAASEFLLSSAGRDYGFECVCLRFFNVFGPRQRPDSPYSGVISIFTDRLRKGLPVTLYGDGTQTRDFVPVREIAGGITAVVGHRGTASGTYNLCTGVRTSLLDLIAVLERVSGKLVQVTKQPPRTGDILHSGGSPHAFVKKFEFKPQTLLEQALYELLNANP